MDNLHQLRIFLQRVTDNVDLRACHISVYTVLCQAWLENDCRNPFNVSRRKVMKLARINSLATYHKVIRELTGSRYILYNPSFHPLKGNEVALLEPTI